MERIPSQEAPTKEEIAIIEVRQRISDVILSDAKFDDDFYLLQWLKSQNLNPGKAEVMIRESIKWRQEQQVDSTKAKEFTEDFLKQFVIPYSKTKEGVPVAYMNAGKMDFKSGLTTCGRTRWVQFWGILFSQMEDKMIEFNKTQNEKKARLTSDSAQGIVVFVDSQDFSSWQLLDSEVLICGAENVRNWAKYFPAVAANMIFYNMNPIFSTLFAAIKPFLSWPNLKLEVYGTDENIWRERLLNIVSLEDLNQLESHWK